MSTSSTRAAPSTMRWRVVSGALLFAASAAVIVQISNASRFGRVGGVAAALVMTLTGIGVWRGRGWAAGGAFLLGVCWFWAAGALFVQSAIGIGAFAGWLAWSILMMVASVQARPERTPPDPLPPAPEDVT